MIRKLKMFLIIILVGILEIYFRPVSRRLGRKPRTILANYAQLKLVKTIKYTFLNLSYITGFTKDELWPKTIVMFECMP